MYAINLYRIQCTRYFAAVSSEYVIAWMGECIFEGKLHVCFYFVVTDADYLEVKINLLYLGEQNRRNDAVENFSNCKMIFSPAFQGHVPGYHILEFVFVSS